MRKLLKVLLTVAMVFCTLNLSAVKVEAAEEEYEIYPKPHKISYTNNDFILREKVNVVYEEGVDVDTKNRLKEVADLKGQTVSTSDAIINTENSDKVTNIIVGIYGSSQYVDNYVKEKYSLSTQDLFSKNDSYFLSVDNGTITVLGRDTDSAFYGLTTLYHVFKQLESKTIRNFTVEDWADVASRGFIEGYYGNPWSTEDRSDLMEWGGYYKLNSYFYAPKDDPKHNANWRTLYTEEEINNKIKPLAEAGNKSKCRFVYALHPYMNNAIRYNTEENYQADLQVMQAKFAQVLAAGVRQISILADDASNVGGANYIRTLNDMTAWLKEQQKTYPDLKITLPFCPQEYMNNGQSYYSQFPDNTQIVMTGGRVWGEVSNSFTTTFTNNVGRGPYLWINWPCTDNSKKHLIMGGYDTFLHPGVDPQKIQGIVLNPMQQSEPSKVAIFGNACYSWNIWESKEEADEAWNDSFKYVDNNSAIETEASRALRELSKHMINQNMDSRVKPLQESVVLKPKLDAFKNDLRNNSVTTVQIDELISEFTELENASKVYRKSAINNRNKDQIVYWLNCWDDTTEATLAYLNAIKAEKENNTTVMLNKYSQGQAAFEKSKSYGFYYVDHTEYAEVGVQHIVPFIKDLGNYLSNKVKTIANPNIITQTYISNTFTNPFSGSEDNLFDKNDSTSMEFRTPNVISKDDYIGVMYNKGITVNKIRFLMAGGKNHIFNSKLQYTTDGTNWTDVNGTVYNRPNGSTEAIEENNLNLENVKGIRLICTSNNGSDAWLTIASIDINKVAVEESIHRVETVTKSDNIVIADSTHPLANIIDGDKSKECWLKAITSDQIPAEAIVTLDLGTVKDIGSVYIAQGMSAAGDVISNGVVEYSTDNATWQNYGSVNNSKEQTVTGGNVSARYIRVRNTTTKNIWWRLSEVQINAASKDIPISYTIIKTSRWQATSNNLEPKLNDGDDNTFTWYDPDGSGNTTGDDVLVGDYLGYNFGKVASLKSAHIVVGAGDGDKLQQYSIETSLTGGADSEWTAVPGYGSYTGAVSGKDTLNIPLNGLEAKYIRIKNLQNFEGWVKFSEFTVTEMPTGEKEHLYTNATTNILSNVSDAKDEASLTPGEITLTAQQYVGLKLDNIKDLKEIVMSLSASHSELKLQVSKNALSWVDVSAGTQTEDARYIRLINIGGTSQTFTINEFKVTSHEVQPIHLHSSNIPITPGWGDTRNNGLAFDGKMATTNKFGGNPSNGQYIIYDLGQSVDIKTLRTYVSDAETDFIRDAKFQLSDDLSTWQDAFTIGDGVLDTDRISTVRNSSVFQNTDSNYPNVLYEGNDQLNITARYLRILMTADYPQRAININEIVINGGAYIPVENSRDYVGALEERGHHASLMGDGDLTTTYKSSLQNSAITYFLSEPTGLKTFRVIQNGAASNATVKATFLSTITKSTGTTETINVGTLNQAINDFIIPDNKKLVSVEIEWGTAIPEISEIILSKNAVGVIDKGILNAELTKTANVNWTKLSIEEFNNAKAVAQGIADGQYYTQDAIDSAIGLLRMAYNNAEVKADATELNDVVNKAILNDNGYYSVRTYQDYDVRVTAIKDALLDSDNISVAIATQLINELQTAEENLVYSIQFREQAKLALEDDKTLGEVNYSTGTYKIYSDAKSALETAIDKDEKATNQGERVTPQDMVTKVTTLQTAMSNLADVNQLKARIAEFDTFDSSLYTKESFDAYKIAIDDGIALLATGTEVTITAQMIVIDEKKAALTIDITAPLDEVIKDALKVNKDNYTKTSYEVLSKIIKEAEALVNPTADQVQEYIRKITDAKKELVSIVALKQRVVDAQDFNEEKYTVQSYKELETAIKEASKVMENGSQFDVDKALDTLNNAIQSLQLSGAQAWKDYVKTIDLKVFYFYTEASYKNYKDAFDKLNALSGDITLNEFNQAKSEFEKYEALLQLKGADYSQIKDLISQIPSDLASYDSQAVQKLKQVMASIDYSKTIKEQSIVDQYAKDLYEALQNVLNSKNGVQTSDTTSILSIMAILVVAGYGIYIFRKRKEDLN